jgi:hypothetical protein
LVSFEKVTKLTIPITNFQNGIYEAIFHVTWVSDKNLDIWIYPNSQSYTGKFIYYSYKIKDNGNGSYSWFYGDKALTKDVFWIDPQSGYSDKPPLIVSMKIFSFTDAKTIQWNLAGVYSNSLGICHWNDTTTIWKDFGFITIYNNQSFSGNFYIKRLI